MSSSVTHDVAVVARIKAVPTILEVIAESTGLGFACVARVTPEEWMACAVRDDLEFGIRAGDSVELATTLCNEVRIACSPIIIEHASADPVYKLHPTPKLYGFESYIAVPIVRPAGGYFGTVCALDRKPAKIRDSKTLPMMMLFADLIGLQLDAEEAHSKAATQLASERENADAREKFIAVLGHDLRNPLASIAMGTRHLLAVATTEKDRRIVQRLQRSAERIELLVDDVLDLARGRIGGGVPLFERDVPDLDARLRHVVDEVASAHPERHVQFDVEGHATIACDPERIDQAASNLLANAILHGQGTVTMKLCFRSDGVVLSVHNRGQAIAPELLGHVFEPFRRDQHPSRRQGLGLGLFIVSEIARAHGGRVEVVSTDDRGTCFTMVIPAATSTTGPLVDAAEAIPMPSSERGQGNDAVVSRSARRCKSKRGTSRSARSRARRSSACASPSTGPSR